jgi:hypothetical protein
MCNKISQSRFTHHLPYVGYQMTLITAKAIATLFLNVATHYGPDGPWILSRLGEICRNCPDRPWGLPSPYTMGTGSSPGVNRPRRGVHHPPPSSIEVKESVELYLYSLSGPSWPVIGSTLILPYRQTSSCHFVLVSLLQWLHRKMNDLTSHPTSFGWPNAKLCLLWARH